jgi:hypothetical protein
MAPRKNLKKSDEAGEGSNPNSDVLSDTTPHVVDSVRSWMQIFEILEHEVMNCPDDFGDEKTDKTGTKLRVIAEAELHKIATRPKLMPYNDMINWALMNTDVQTRSIINHQKVVVGSFRPEHIQVMYKLSPVSKYIYNAEFVEEFQRKECTEFDQTYPDIIKTWWGVPAKFRADSHGVYATASLNEYMVYIAMMLCRLFGRKIPTHFPAEWVPIMHEVAEGFTFNWDKILSDNLTKEIVEYQMEKSKGQPASFYMSAYVMDAICYMTPFPLMNWSWNPTCAEPIHFYHSKLWEEKVKDFFYEICHYVVIPVHQILYGYPPPRISEQIMGNLKTVADWFIEENFSYIRVFGCSIPPHALPKFLPDRLVCREVAYQIITGGIDKELKAVQKKFWPTFPIQIGRFSLLNFGHSKVEAAALEDIKLVDVELRRHDPYQIVGNHLAHCNMKTYEHEDSPCDDIFKGIRAYEEILDRVQALPPDLQANFLAFQKHRRSGLPKILQGESITPPSEQESIPPGFEPKSLDKRTTEENPKNPEVSSQRSETSQTEHPGSETEFKSETPLKPESNDFSFIINYSCRYPQNNRRNTIHRVRQSYYNIDSFTVKFWDSPS